MQSITTSAESVSYFAMEHTVVTQAVWQRWQQQPAVPKKWNTISNKKEQLIGSIIIIIILLLQ